VLLGFIHVEDLGKEIADTLKIDGRIANNIADALNKKIFAPLHPEIQKVYSPIITPETGKRPVPVPLGQVSGSNIPNPPAPKETSTTMSGVMPPHPTTQAAAMPAPVMLHQEASSETTKATTNFHFDVSPTRFATTANIPEPPKPAHVEIGSAPKASQPEAGKIQTGAGRVVNYGAQDAQPIANIQFGQVAQTTAPVAQAPRVSTEKGFIPPPPPHSAASIPTPPMPPKAPAPTPTIQTVVMPTVHTVEKTIEKNYTTVPTVVMEQKSAPWKRPEEYAPMAETKSEYSPAPHQPMPAIPAQPQVHLEMKQVSSPQATPIATAAPQKSAPVIKETITQPAFETKPIQKTPDTLDLSSLQRVAPTAQTAPPVQPQAQVPVNPPQSQQNINIPSGAPIVINATVAAVQSGNQSERQPEIRRPARPLPPRDIATPRVPGGIAEPFSRSELNPTNTNIHPAKNTPPPAPYASQDPTTLPVRPSETIQRTSFNQKTIDLSSFQKVRNTNDGPALDGNTVALK
jgi:hypothetical protein